MRHARAALHFRIAFVAGALALASTAFAAQESRAWLREAPAATQAPAVSADGLWTQAVGVKALSAGKAAPRLAAFVVMQADAAALSSRLLRAPTGQKGAPVGAGTVLTLPMPDGTFERFAIERIDLLAPELQARFPDLHTFRGQGLDDPAATARLELSPFGFRAYVMREDGDTVVDPIGDGVHYRVFRKRDAARDPFFCGTHDVPAVDEGLPRLKIAKARPNGNTLRTYRFAASLTGEYTRFFANANCPAGSPANCPETAAAAALTTTMNRVTGLFERDTAVSFTVVATRIFTDPATDPFADGTKVDAALLAENQTTLDANPGTANYDIGHVFTAQASGGFAPGRACDAANKARGGTGRPTPAGDPYDVDYVAHEVGHQLSASHTWTGTNNSCSAAAFTSTSAYEPGSGSTIMAYAGICGPDNLQANSDAYFHVRSIDQVTDFRNDAGSGGACGTVTTIANALPAVNAGPNFTIPRDTPFVLTASATDGDGPTLTYAWEQYDLGGQVNGIPAATQTTGPLFRSFSPTASASRTFPRLEALLGTASSPWEVLPDVDRAMNFRVTARDNRVGAGGTDFAQMTVNVSGAPFFVSSPNDTSSLQCGTGSTLSWTVGGGNVAATVRADYSGDNGASFAPLIASTANDGSEGYTVPRPPTANGRIRLAANGNIFFDISPRFAIVDTLPPTVTAPPATGAECTGPGGTLVTLGTATRTDACDLAPSLVNNAPSQFPLGTTTVTWSSTDASGNTGTATQLVTIVDTTPPTLAFTLTPDMLWPPNHRLARIQAALQVADVCDPNPVVRLLSIVSNEPDNGLGDGDTEGDIQEAQTGSDDREFELRSERSGTGSGRIYTITYEARDASGNATVRSATVVVPKSQQ